MRIITGRARGLQLNVPKNYDVRPTADRVKGPFLILLEVKLLGLMFLIYLLVQEI